MSIDALGRTVTWGEAIDLIEVLTATPGTHLHAALADWAWPATVAELAAIDHAEWYMNRHRDTKKHRELIELPRPWSGVKKVADVTDAERERLRAVLIASSPFGH